MYPPNFISAMTLVAANEGVDSDHPSDRGGRTRYGIIVATLKQMGQWGDLDRDGDIDADDIRLLTWEHAMEIYYRQWWQRYNYDEIESEAVSATFLDLSIVLGQYQATRCMQRACRCCGYKLVIDGILGPKTRNAINLISMSKIGEASLLASFRSECAGVFRMIVQKAFYTDNDSQRVFLYGWLNRAYNNYLMDD